MKHKEQEAEDLQCFSGAEPSALATEIGDLKRDVLKAVEKRDRMPQPTFWYLLHDRLREIKQKKALKRALEQAFSSVEE